MLVHQNFSTLYVLSAGVVLAIVFESVIDFIRQYVLLNATTKIDIRIARATFAHLLSLPVEFFERSSAGVVTKHMQQTEIVRQFLTGQLFLTLLDSLVIVVFLPVLMFYSLALSGIVVLFSATIAGVIFFLIGPFRRRLHELYMAEGERQAVLVETIGGMQTVKGLALEPRQRRRWDSIAANAVARNFDVGKISLVARTASQSLEKLMIVAIVAIGALIVFAGEMTVGELVAFQMLAGRISNPLVRLVALIHEYQEALLSVRMLGNVMNAAPERTSGRGLRTPIRGAIELSDVTFTYPNTNKPALRDLNIHIPAGSVVGIVGRSGSGKSTLAKLLEGIIFADSGVTRIDGVDVREYDLSHLRNHMGIVLQDSFLFRGSVRDNVAATRPDSAFEDIVAACRNAGADEFIEQLPQGYTTELEEAAVNLSGGQRQRLAIAARASAQSGDPDPGRSDQCPRSRKRGRGPGQPRADRLSAHDDRDLPSPVDGASRRPHHRARSGAHRRRRPARSAAPDKLALRPDVGAAARRCRRMKLVRRDPREETIRGFKPDADALESLPLPFPGRTLLYLVIGLVVAAVAWASLSKVDRVVTAKGRLVTTAPRIVIQSLETSIIKSMHVKVGDRVRAGQILATLDSTFVTADITALTSQRDRVLAQIERLDAEVHERDHRPAHANVETDLQRAIYEHKRAEMTARLTSFDRKTDEMQGTKAVNAHRIVRIREQVDVLTELVRMRSEAQKKGAGSRSEVLEAQVNRLELLEELEGLEAQEVEIDNRLKSNAAERELYIRATVARPSRSWSRPGSGLMRWKSL